MWQYSLIKIDEILENNDYNNRRPINKRLSEVYLNDSYNIVNEKIIKLKKLEFVFSNLTEILKHYAVVQDIIAKSLLDNSLAQNDVISIFYLEKLLIWIQ